MSIRFGFFSNVNFSTSKANSRCGVFGIFFAKFKSSSHLLSGLNFDFTLCPIHGINSHFCFIVSTYSFGEIPFFTASEKYFQAPSIAHQNLGHIVVSQAIRLDLTSFQALAVIIAFVAQETAGPWSARSIINALINSIAYSGKSLFNHKFQIT